MEKSLTTTEAKTTAALVNWNDPAMQLQIKETYGKGLNDGEWKLFVGLGVATGLNPFLREIWAVKYGTNPASVFIGRDGYRRSAQNHPEYEYHFADAVCANDVYKVVSGEVTHEYTLKDRGPLVGAYCIVKRKSASKPAVTFVDLKEYIQAFGVWKTKPATMIKKVAEAQGLRASFQELFAGTYEESEDWNKPKNDSGDLVEVKPEEWKHRSELGKQAPSASQTPTKPPRATKSKVVDAAVVEDEHYDGGYEPVEDASQTPPPPEYSDHDDIEGKTVAPQATAPAKAAKITTDQTRKLYDVWSKYKAACKMPEAESATRRQALMTEMFNVKVSTSLNEEQGDALIAKIEEMTREASM